MHVDGIDSIIGRAGFKLGRNFGDNKKNTFYLKADVLREFLGEQFVSVKDVTSDNEYVGLNMTIVVIGMRLVLVLILKLKKIHMHS